MLYAHQATFLRSPLPQTAPHASKEAPAAALRPLSAAPGNGRELSRLRARIAQSVKGLQLAHRKPLIARTVRRESSVLAVQLAAVAYLVGTRPGKDHRAAHLVSPGNTDLHQARKAARFVLKANFK